MSEFEHIINEFFDKEIKVQTFYELNQEVIYKVIKEAKEYEKPDILSVYDNKIIGIEHFEFDSYNKSTKKGSDFKINDNRETKRIDKEIKKGLQNNDQVMVYGEINSSSSLDNYYKNFELIFEEHYKRIQAYIEQIKEDFKCQKKEIHICFFAEDVTPLGNYYFNKGNKREILPLLPIYCVKIRELLKNSPLVEYLILGCFYMNEKRLFIIKNSKEVLKRISNEHIEINNDSFFSFEPQMIGFAFKTPKDEAAKIINE